MDPDELAKLLVKERAEHAQQGAKALAILEVKDDVISRLERELDVAQTENQDQGDVLSHARQRERHLEEQVRRLQDRFDAAQLEAGQEQELLRRAREQAETDAVVAHRDLAAAHREAEVLSLAVARAEQQAQSGSSEFVEEQRAVARAAQQVKLLVGEVESAKLEASKRATAESTRPTSEDMGRVEAALLQCQRDLAQAERELHSMRRVELERSLSEASEQRLVTVLNRELSEARSSLHREGCEWREAEVRTELVEQSGRRQIAELEVQVAGKAIGSHVLSCGTQTVTQSLSGWLEESLRRHDIALSDLLISIQQEAENGVWGFRNRASDDKHMEFNKFNSQIRSLQEEFQLASAQGRESSEQTAILKAHHDMALADSKIAQKRFESLYEESEEEVSKRSSEIVAYKERLSKREAEEARTNQSFEMQLHERQEQLCVACRSLETAGIHSDQRVAELTGRVLMLMRSEHIQNHRLMLAEHEAERNIVSHARLEGNLESAQKCVERLKAGERRLTSLLQQRSEEVGEAMEQFWHTSAQCASLKAQLADAHTSQQQQSQLNESWSQRIADLHKAHVEQLQRERSVSEEHSKHLLQQFEQPQSTTAAEIVLQDLHEIVESGKRGKSRKATGIDASRDVSELFSSALQQLSRLERRSVLSEVEVAWWRQQKSVAAASEATLQREVTLLRQEVLLLQRRAISCSQEADVKEDLSCDRRQLINMLARCDEAEVTSSKYEVELNGANAKSSELTSELRSAQAAEATNAQRAAESAEQAVLRNQRHWRDELVAHSISLADVGGDETAERELGLELAIHELTFRLEEAHVRADGINLRNASLHSELGNTQGVHDCTVRRFAVDRSEFLEQNLALECARSQCKAAHQHVGILRGELSAERLHCENLVQDLRSLSSASLTNVDESQSANCEASHQRASVSTNTPQQVTDGSEERSQVPNVIYSIVEHLAKACQDLAHARENPQRIAVLDEAIAQPNMPVQQHAERESLEKVEHSPETKAPASGSQAASGSRVRVMPGTKSTSEEQGQVVLSELQKIGHLCELVHEQVKQRESLEPETSGSRGSSAPPARTHQEARTRKHGAKVSQSSMSEDSHSTLDDPKSSNSPAKSRLSRHSPIAMRQRIGAATTDATQRTVAVTTDATQRTVAVATDPELQHAGVQTLHVRISNPRELPEHEARLEAAEVSQTQLMSRVETVLGVQRKLQARYKVAAEQLVEVREDRAVHLERADELQAKVLSCTGELETAVSAEISTLEEWHAHRQSQRSEFEEEMSHVAAARDAERLQTENLLETRCELRAAMLEQDLAENHARHALREVGLERRRAAREETVAMQALREYQGVERELAIERYALEEEVPAAEAKAFEAGTELQDRCEALVMATGAARDAEGRVSQVREVLRRTEAELTDAQRDRAEAHAEAQCERAAAVLAGTEVSAQGMLVDELQGLAHQRRDLQLRLEAAEASQLWAEISRKEDRDAWREDAMRFEEHIRREASEAGMAAQEARELDERAHHDFMEQRWAQLEEARIKEENEQLKHQNVDLSGLLRAAHHRFDEFRSEYHSEEAKARRADVTLQRELGAVRGREAALLQELERLRSAVLARDVGTGNSGKPEDGARTVQAASDGAVTISSLSDGEVDSRQQLHREAPRGARRSDHHRAELRRLQRIVAQERELHEQHRSRSAASEKDAVQLRERLQALESQLKFTREESERKKALITSLQQKCSSSTGREDLDMASEYEEARQSLVKAKREVNRRDATIQELRQEMSEVRQQRQQQRQREEADAAQSEAEAARAKALRAEAQRKDQLLKNARSQVEAMEIKLASAEKETETRGAQLRKLRASSSAASARRGGTTRSSAAAPVGAATALDRRAVPLERLELGGSGESISSLPGLSKMVAATDVALNEGGRLLENFPQERRHSEHSDMIGHSGVGGSSSTMPPAVLDVPASLLSSLEASALEESLHILNIGKEDLADFLAQ